MSPADKAKAKADRIAARKAQYASDAAQAKADRIDARVTARREAKASAIASRLLAGKMKPFSEMSWQEIFDFIIGRDRWTGSGRWDVA